MKNIVIYYVQASKLLSKERRICDSGRFWTLTGSVCLSQRIENFCSNYQKIYSLFIKAPYMHR